MSDNPKPKTYLRIAQVRRRYGDCSPMWVVRAMAQRGFPQPTTFGGRDRLWLESELDDWDKVHGALKPKPLPVPPPPPRKAVA